jgi:hypothetical protein
MKQCRKCNEEKHEGEFGKDVTRPDGMHPYCSDCRRLEKKKAYDKDPEKHRKQKRDSHNKHKEKINAKRRSFNKTDEGKYLWKKATLRALYGISPEKYNELRLLQNNCCAICNTHEENVSRGPSSSSETALHIDHCHDTNKVRGLLCMNCNTMLGQAKDSIDLLKSAINYLEKNQ